MPVSCRPHLHSHVRSKGPEWFRSRSTDRVWIVLGCQKRGDPGSPGDGFDRLIGDDAACPSRQLDLVGAILVFLRSIRRPRMPPKNSVTGGSVRPVQTPHLALGIAAEMTGVSSG